MVVDETAISLKTIYGWFLRGILPRAAASALPLPINMKEKSLLHHDAETMKFLGRTIISTYPFLLPPTSPTTNKIKMTEEPETETAPKKKKKKKTDADAPKMKKKTDADVAAEDPDPDDDDGPQPPEDKS
jgi:hypothetical protein